MLERRAVDPAEASARIEAGIGRLEAHPEAAVRRDTGELVSSLLALYGEALARVLAIATSEAGDRSGRLLECLASEPLVASLLVLHDLHPLEPRARAVAALARVAAQTGVRLELAEMAPAEALVRGEGIAPAAVAEVRRSVERALLESVPALERVRLEAAGGPVAAGPSPRNGNGVAPTSGLLQIRPHAGSRTAAASSSARATSGGAP